MTDLFEQIWKALPRDLFTSQNKGSKAEALKEWGKLKVDQDMYDLMLEFMELKETADRAKRKDGFCPGWPHFCRMLKRQFWLDDKPIIKREKYTNPNKCQCGGEIDHGGHRCCWPCYDERFGDSLTGHGATI